MLSADAARAGGGGVVGGALDDSDQPAVLRVGTQVHAGGAGQPLQNRFSMHGGHPHDHAQNTHFIPLCA